MKTYKEILNNKSTQQIRLITIHNILNDIDMNLLTEKQRESLIVDVVNQYDILYNEAKNIQVVNITTAVELSETIKQKLVVQLKFI